MCSGYAAEIELHGPREDTSGKQYQVRISGRILPGDAKKLSAFLTSNRVTMSILNSPGGDVFEAIRMGEIIGLMRIQTMVEARGSCASACFFIWIHGFLRLAAPPEYSNRIGRLGLHRPFLLNSENSTASLAAQTNLMRYAAAYLQTKFIPGRLIDFMMNRPSNDIYWLTYEDIDELGEVPPDLEELYISKCKFDRKLVLQRAKAKREDGPLFEKLDAEFVRVEDCRSELNHQSRREWQAKLLSGWLPPNPFQPQTKQEKFKPDTAEARKVSQAHPDWEKLVTTGAFKRWKSAQPIGIQELGESEKASDAIRMLDLYKRDLKDGK